ncbi:MAG: CpsD/CapB family tyrosine-protein kinase, partial [Clostridia bacterium]|nr:CpsD/CapB family tyrosine-protein kinase [Clostridia bacterium]
MNKLEMGRFKPLSYACTEAINALCTNLTFTGDDKKVVMVTSAQSNEGKSFISMNIMRTFAELGKRVVLVDTDLRRSQITAKYGVRVKEGNGMGLSHYLAGMCSVEDALYETNIENAYMVPLSREVSNSLSLLNNNRLQILLQDLKSRFDYVIVDAPPVGIIIDAAEIAKHCDGVIITVKYNAVSRRELIDVKNQIELTGCPLLGVVLNSVSFESLTSKKYYHKSYY